jgi:putative ABC transport system ATP-binding protein
MKAHASATLIAMHGVAKRYHLGDTTVAALRDVDLTVHAGEFTALSGPSGSGKSTLLNLCGLLDAADSGAYHLQGENITRLSAAARTRLRRERIGFVFQTFNLVPVMTAYENVEYPLLLNNVGAAARRRRVHEMLEQVGLAPFARHLPDRLSGGQRQRVAIARALVKQPLLVIADEPTANLDTATANQIIDLMHHFANTHHATFLVATHDQRMTARCERVVELVDGAIKTPEVRHAVA